MNETTEEVQFTGEIVGGGGYVVAAWGISLTMLLVYVVVTTLRYRKARAAKEAS
jgi:hypothetical protein